MSLAKKNRKKRKDKIRQFRFSGNSTRTCNSTPYQNQLEYGKIKFIITSPQSATANTFTVVPSGFTMSNDTMTMDCEGMIIKSEVG